MINNSLISLCRKYIYIYIDILELRSLGKLFLRVLWRLYSIVRLASCKGGLNKTKQSSFSFSGFIFFASLPGRMRPPWIEMSTFKINFVVGFGSLLIL